MDGLTVLERGARNGPTFRVLKLDEEPSRRTAIDIELERIPCDDERGRSEFAAGQSGVGGDEADAAQRLLVYLGNGDTDFLQILKPAFIGRNGGKKRPNSIGLYTRDQIH